jgi:hypothetical protein
VCVRMFTGLFVGPFVLVNGLCRLCTVAAVTKRSGDGLWIIHGVLGGGLYLSWA